MAFFAKLAKVFRANKFAVEASSAGMLVTLPLAGGRRQTVKVTAHKIPRARGAVVALRVISRVGHLEDHKLVKHALEYNAGKQRVSLVLTGDVDPPALDVMLCFPTDVHDENLPHVLFGVMREVALVADRLEQKVGGGDDDF